MITMSNTDTVLILSLIKKKGLHSTNPIHDYYVVVPYCIAKDTVESYRTTLPQMSLLCKTPFGHPYVIGCRPMRCMAFLVFSMQITTSDWLSVDSRWALQPCDWPKTLTF